MCSIFSLLDSNRSVKRLYELYCYLPLMHDDNLYQEEKLHIKPKTLSEGCYSDVSAVPEFLVANVSGYYIQACC